MYKVIAIFIVLISTTPACFAGQSPESVVSQYFETLKDKGYGAIARFIHPDEQKKFKKMTSSMIEMVLESDDLNAASLLADPKDGTKIRSLADEEYMNAVMKWYGLSDPELSNLFRNTNYKIIGSVKEEDLIHVVVRLSIGIRDIMTVMSL